jgi:hypothetical protein
LCCCFCCVVCAAAAAAAGKTYPWQQSIFMWRPTSHITCVTCHSCRKLLGAW